MPRIERIDIAIKTGAQGTTSPVTFQFNGHQLAFEDVSGGTGESETFEGGFELNSFAHSVALNGPEAGSWDVEEIRVSYGLGDSEPYEICFGKIQLDETNAVDIWRDPPPPTFDV